MRQNRCTIHPVHWVKRARERTAGAAGPVVSIITVTLEGVLVPLKLSVVVQLTLWPELSPVTLTVALALAVPIPVSSVNVTGDESTVQLIDEIVALPEAVAVTVPEAGEVMNQPLLPSGENETTTIGNGLTETRAVVVAVPSKESVTSTQKLVVVERVDVVNEAEAPF